MIPTERLKGTRESRHTQSPGLCFRIVLTYGETETFYLGLWLRHKPVHSGTIR
jgi:hypothetical protein